MSHPALSGFAPRPLYAAVALLLLLLAPAPALAAVCVVPDNGTGTVTLPPAGCGYVSPADLHMMINGLPPGTTIEVAAEHRGFFNIVNFPGGSLGGEVEQFQSELFMVLTGTGALAGYLRTISVPVQCETHVGPRVPGSPVQDFDTDMYLLQGHLFGDPDFDQLHITGGTGNGLPSPGHTTLTRLPGGDFNVDSFFDIVYEIEFTGAPGGPLAGLTGVTNGTIRMQSGQPAPSVPPCTVASNGAGTVNLPPEGCGYVSPQDLHVMIDGLPPGTTIEVAAEHRGFFNAVVTPGGPLGGEIETFQSTLHLDMNGTGSLAGFHRVIDLPAQVTTAVGPRVPGAAVQDFDTEMVQLQGQIFGDPDFDLLHIVAGSAAGLPSPGHTTLTLQPGGQFNVDSFFDVEYRIDFQGAPGGVLAGLTGQTTGTLRMRTGVPVAPPPGPCVVVDNGTGTVDLPPPGCGYVSPDDLHRMINGLPAGTEIHISAEHSQFFNSIVTPGGSLGGEIETFQSSLILTLTGTGDLSSYARSMIIPVSCETHVGPRDPTSSTQSFDTEMVQLEGSIFGDPDFDQLHIIAGSGNGLPSPGHTTITRLGSSGGGTGGGAGGAPSYNIDSFFDITYQIDFIGAPGGPFAGLGGVTTGTVRMRAGQPTLVSVPGQRPLEKDVQLSNSPNPFSPGTVLQYRLPTPAMVRIEVFDISGQRVRTLLEDRMPAGPHAMMWDGRDDIGRRLGSGTYFIRLDVDGQTVASRKAILVR